MAVTDPGMYGNGVKPTHDAAGKNMCSNATSYKPVDVSGLRGIVTSAFDEAKSNVMDYQDNILGQLSELENAWGLSYVNIDGGDLGLLNNVYASTYIRKDNYELDQQKEKVLAEIGAIEAATESVNNYLIQLENNYNKYKSLEKEVASIQIQINNYYYNAANEIPQPYINIARLQTRVNELQTQMNSYNKISEPNGSWIRG